MARLGHGARILCQDTVPIVFWIASARAGDFRGAVETALAAGGDRDTIGAMVGGIVAARVGSERIPPEWRARVEPLPSLQK